LSATFFHICLTKQGFWRTFSAFLLLLFLPTFRLQWLQKEEKVKWACATTQAHFTFSSWGGGSPYDQGWQKNLYM